MGIVHCNEHTVHTVRSRARSAVYRAFGPGERKDDRGAKENAHGDDTVRAPLRLSHACGLDSQLHPRA